MTKIKLKRFSTKDKWYWMFHAIYEDGQEVILRAAEPDEYKDDMKEEMHQFIQDEKVDPSDPDHGKLVKHSDEQLVKNGELKAAIKGLKSKYPKSIVEWV